MWSNLSGQFGSSQHSFMGLVCSQMWYESLLSFFRELKCKFLLWKICRCEKVEEAFPLEKRQKVWGMRRAHWKMKSLLPEHISYLVPSSSFAMRSHGWIPNQVESCSACLFFYFIFFVNWFSSALENGISFWNYAVGQPKRCVLPRKGREEMGNRKWKNRSPFSFSIWLAAEPAQPGKPSDFFFWSPNIGLWFFSTPCESQQMLQSYASKQTAD